VSLLCAARIAPDGLTLRWAESATDRVCRRCAAGNILPLGRGPLYPPVPIRPSQRLVCSGADWYLKALSTTASTGQRSLSLSVGNSVASCVPIVILVHLTARWLKAVILLGQRGVQLRAVRIACEPRPAA